jgi:hypothetical protein
VSPDPDPGPTPAGATISQPLRLATKLVLEAAGLDESSSAARLVADRVLPAVYRDRYDEAFLRDFAASLESTRDVLSGERPQPPDTLSELAARAIFREARGAVRTRGRGCLDLASQVDPDLPEQLERGPQRLSAELDRLSDAVFADGALQALFRLEPGDAIEDMRLGPEERERLRFENWRVPFGDV